MSSKLTNIVAVLPPAGPPASFPPMRTALATVCSRTRQAIPFRAVNHSGSPAYDPGLQRHHLLPKRMLSQRCFGPMFNAIGRDWLGFDDFRRNGLLLPAHDGAALVIERVGQVEALQRLTLLQGALRRRLLRPRGKPMVLNRFDPMQKQVDFTELDAMVDMLWPETQDLADLGL